MDINFDDWKIELKQEHLNKIDLDLREIISEIQAQTPSKQLWRLMKARAKSN